MTEIIHNGAAMKTVPVEDRLAKIPETTITQLAMFSILNQGISFDSVAFFFESCGMLIESEETIQEWLICWIENGLIEISLEDDRAFFNPCQDVKTYFETHLGEETIKTYHEYAHSFYMNWVRNIATSLDIPIPADEKERNAVFFGPNGVLDWLIHHPEAQTSFKVSLNVALNWQDHLFELKRFEDAAHIINMSCFAIAREGQRMLAQSMLFRIIGVTQGMPNLVSRVNLATLLREDSQLDGAMQIYRGAVMGLIIALAFRQLAMVLSEMGAIYRQKGNLMRAAFLLEFCSGLHALLGNKKSEAIACSQLASVFRYMKLFGLALFESGKACRYFRKSNDQLNLGRSLLTRGNILYNLKSAEKALLCFDEAKTIGTQISDWRTVSGALSGRARVLMLIHQLDEVKTLLDEAITIKQRTSDRSIGIEYENLGHYYELDHNPGMALAWYQKALKFFEQYEPMETGHCKLEIARIEAVLKKRHLQTLGKT